MNKMEEKMSQCNLPTGQKGSPAPPSLVRVYVCMCVLTLASEGASGFQAVLHFQAD